MKKAAVALVVIVAVCTAYAAARAAEGSASPSGVKIGYVDMNRSLNEVNEGRTAKAQLEADGKAKKQKLEIMQNELKKMKDDLDKQRLILSKDALAEKEAEFQKKFLELQKTSFDFEQEFSKKEAEFIKPISVKLQTVIQQIGQSEGYTLIVPKEMALYSTSGSDLTDKVIAAYNKGK
jgi:outer membrane protein